MSNTDHHGANVYRSIGGERVNGVLYAVARKSAKLPTAKADIAEQLRDDSPVRAIVERQQPTKRVRIQRFVPNDTRIGALREGGRNPRTTEGFVPRVGAREVQFANLDVVTPSLMQMARNRAQALGMVG
jgi:hypothetical protein